MILLMVAVPLRLVFDPVLSYIDTVLVDFRFAANQRNATGSIVYVAIDKTSMDKVGTWPWPRGIYADAIDRLAEAGVEDIFIDVDFSTPSSPAEDKKLADALANAGGGVILPIFRQHARAAAGASAIVTRPMGLLAKNAWLAFANVDLDGQGRVRRFELGQQLDGIATQSAAAVLARHGQATGSYPIDFSIIPSTIPTYSFSDVLDGTIDTAVLKGKSVVIGAYATELNDIYPVPIYGALSGPLIHMLAAETLLQGRLLTSIDQTPLELLLVAIVVCVALVARSTRVVAIVAAAVGLIVSCEALAYCLQSQQDIIIYTARPWIIVSLGVVLFLGEKIDFGSFLTKVAVADHQSARSLLQLIVAESTDGVIVFDEQFHVLERNASASTLGVAEIGHHGLADCVPAPLAAEARDLADRYAMRPGQSISSSLQFSAGEAGAPKHFEASITISPTERHLENGIVEAGTFLGSIIVRDRTARQNYENKLLHLSRYDDLTGLWNRREFKVQLDLLQRPQAVIAVGIHRFSVLSATLGRHVGDQLLKAVASRLETAPDILLAGKLENDTFAVVVRQENSSTHEMMADTVFQVFAEPFAVEGFDVRVEARLGISPNVNESQDGDVSIEQAEHALEDTRSGNGPDWSTFDPRRASQQQRARLLEQAMRVSLDRGEFFLAYQPQVDLRTARVIGAEALLRWNHVDFGSVSPAEFIPVAEASGFVCELGRWALFEACKIARQWPEDLSIAVNVSPIQFAKSDIVEEVREALSRSGLAPHRLHLEITESALMDGTEKIMSTIEQLRRMGIAMALDDFGTGYSNLSYMAGFPLDKLKIDQSFVRKLETDPKSVVIVDAIAALAKGLGLEIVAEGIESEQEWRILADLGCEVGQGYFFGKPQSSEDLITLYRATPRGRAA